LIDYLFFFEVLEHAEDVCVEAVDVVLEIGLGLEPDVAQAAI